MRFWTLHGAALFCGAVAVWAVSGSAFRICQAVLGAHKRPGQVSVPRMSKEAFQSLLLSREELLAENQRTNFSDEWRLRQLRWALEPSLKCPASEMIFHVSSSGNLHVMRRGREGNAPLLILPLSNLPYPVSRTTSSDDENSYVETLRKNRNMELSDSALSSSGTADEAVFGEEALRLMWKTYAEDEDKFIRSSVISVANSRVGSTSNSSCGSFEPCSRTPSSCTDSLKLFLINSPVAYATEQSTIPSPGKADTHGLTVRSAPPSPNRIHKFTVQPVMQPVVHSAI